MTIEPDCPGVSGEPQIQVGRTRNAFSTAVVPPSECPLAAAPPPGYVDRPSMSSRVRPASAMARMHASTVSASGSRISRRPTSDIPIPEIATLSSNLSGDAIGRACQMVSSSAGSGPGSGSPVGANSGNHTSSCCVNSTATFIPTCTASGSHPTTFVVSRTRSSSSSATIAMTYGGLIVGSHWCVFTVYPTTVPRPDTSTTSISVEWQCGQTGVGGKSNAPHGMLRCTRNTPSRPAVQKNSFSGVSSGSGRW